MSEGKKVVIMKDAWGGVLGYHMSRNRPRMSSQAKNGSVVRML